MKEEIIIKILTRASAFLNSEQVNQLRMALEEELYHCTITTECTALIVSGNFPSRAALFLACKKLDGYSQHTIDNYKRILQHFYSVISKDVEQITTMDIRMYLALRTKDNLKRSTIATITGGLKSFFSWLTDEEYISKNPMKKIKNMKKEKRLRKALTREELELLREACQTQRDKAMLEVFYSTGCRLAEILNLNKSDINWTSGSVRVIGKGDKERIVFLNARSALHLKMYLNSRNDSNPALFVSTRQPHERLSRRGIERVFSSLGKRAGINKPVYPHILRHTTATNMINNGASLMEVQLYLGHDSPDTTQIYAEMDAQAIQISHSRHVV